MSNKHYCENNIHIICDNYLVEIKKENNLWYLVYESLADAQNVKLGEADEIGELMHGVTLQIFYCPFCGKRL